MKCLLVRWVIFYVTVELLCIIYFFTDVDECEIVNFCQNNGKCTNSEGSFECECADGYKGETCQQGKLNYLQTT